MSGNWTAQKEMFGENEMNITNDNKEQTVKTSQDLLFVQPNKLQKDLIVCKEHIQFGQNKPTFRVPQSDVLGRVKNFLPQICDANERLNRISSVEKEKLDIENISDNEDNFIEMNLALVSDSLLVSDCSEDEEDASAPSIESDGGALQLQKSEKSKSDGELPKKSRILIQEIDT